MRRARLTEILNVGIILTSALLLCLQLHVLNSAEVTTLYKQMKIADTAVAVNVPSFTTDATTESSNRPSIAVCVSGMPERFQPWHLFRHLVEPNAEKFKIHIVYALAQLSALKYSTAPKISFEPSPYSNLTTPQKMSEQLVLELKNATTGLKQTDTTLTVLPLIEDLNETQWRTRLGVPELDRIWRYTSIQSSILNMYHHQVACAEHIAAIEKDTGNPFEWIVSTREDAFFFKDLDLERLTSQNMTESCAIITKDCLNWGGLNMRFQLLRRRDFGLDVLLQRLDFYKSMYHSEVKRTIVNPEQFEQSQVHSLGVKSCALSVSDVPVTAARHTRNGDYCFAALEISQNCVPGEAIKAVRQKLCRSSNDPYKVSVTCQQRANWLVKRYNMTQEEAHLLALQENHCS